MSDKRQEEMKDFFEKLEPMRSQKWRTECYCK